MSNAVLPRGLMEAALGLLLLSWSGCEGSSGEDPGGDLPSSTGSGQSGSGPGSSTGIAPGGSERAPGSSEADDTAPLRQEGSPAAAAISDEIPLTNEECASFNVTGHWEGTWAGSGIVAFLSGTWAVEVQMSPDGEISGPINVTGAPCSASTGTVKGKLIGCSIEFDTNLGSGNSGDCPFTWKGKLTSHTADAAEGTWLAYSLYPGTWSGRRL